MPLSGPAAWADWHEELSADAVSVLLSGNAAAWAMDELLFGPPAELLAGTRGYPPPVVRAAFMLAAARGSRAPARAGCAVPCARLDRYRRARRRPPGSGALLPDVPAVANAVAAADLDGSGTLPSLCGFDPRRSGESGEVNFWSREFAKGNEPLPGLAPRGGEARARRRRRRRGRTSPRRTEDGARRAKQADEVRKAVVATLPKLRPPGRRATPPAADTTDAAASLLDVLLGERPLTPREA